MEDHRPGMLLEREQCGGAAAAAASGLSAVVAVHGVRPLLIQTGVGWVGWVKRVYGARLDGTGPLCSAVCRSLCSLRLVWRCGCPGALVSSFAGHTRESVRSAHSRPGGWGGGGSPRCLCFSVRASVRPSVRGAQYMSSPG